MLVRDGEGATRIAEVRVEGARTRGRGRPHRPHRGRVAAREDRPPRRRPQLGPHPGRRGPRGRRRSTSAALDICIGDVWVAEGGAARAYDEAAAAAAMREDPVRIRVRLRRGRRPRGWMWTCDLSHGYVDINAHYRS